MVKCAPRTHAEGTHTHTLHTLAKGVWQILAEKSKANGERTPADGADGETSLFLNIPVRKCFSRTYTHTHALLKQIFGQM